MFQLSLICANNLNAHCSTCSNTAQFCKFVLYDIDSVQNWCLENARMVSISEIVTYFIHKINHTDFNDELCNDFVFHFQYQRPQSSLMLRTLFSHLK
jgi:hypothetical protein